MDETKEDEIYFLGAATLLVVISTLTSALHTKKKRKVWARNWLRRRPVKSNVLTLLNKELRVEDSGSYKNFLRMSNKLFEQLLKAVENDIGKKDTFMRDSISARNRLEITLRFLATGETFQSLMFATRVHVSTISRFVPEVCRAIIKALESKYLKMPSTTDEWKNVALKFYELWDFPHCIGALDGKHISFRAPRSAGSYYYNYKGFHSVVLLALVDAEYKFLYAHVGTNGRISDGGVFRESNLSKMIEQNSINLPNSEPLPGCVNNSPYVIVADDAFPLSTHMLKPYSQRNLSYENRIFNYRLSRARRIVENAFGILSNRFRVLLTTIVLCPEKVDLITYCCVVLHNFLLQESKESYINVACDKSCSLSKALISRSNRCTATAFEVREEFKRFFSSPEGVREWQQAQIEKSNF